jgi:hypothetical protein
MDQRLQTAACRNYGCGPRVNPADEKTKIFSLKCYSQNSLLHVKPHFTLMCMPDGRDICWYRPAAIL